MQQITENLQHKKSHRAEVSSSHGRPCMLIRRTLVHSRQHPRWGVPHDNGQ